MNYTARHPADEPWPPWQPPWPPRYEFPLGWEAEWRIERAALWQRLRAMWRPDPSAEPERFDTRQRLVGLAGEVVHSEREWLALGRAIRDLEYELRHARDDAGRVVDRLPKYRWPPLAPAGPTGTRGD
jgi:hypothetical protein